MEVQAVVVMILRQKISDIYGCIGDFVSCDFLKNVLF
jgi:hypothetical protein